jgi:hypothetical protein
MCGGFLPSSLFRVRRTRQALCHMPDGVNGVGTVPKRFHILWFPDAPVASLPLQGTQQTPRRAVPCPGYRLLLLLLCDLRRIAGHAALRATNAGVAGSGMAP